MHVGDRTLATHGLIFVLAGIFSGWKQNIAFYLTPDSYDGALLNPIVLEIITKAESIGLYVHNITNDMGSNNLAMWRNFLVGFAGRYSKVTNSIIHPVRNNHKLWFIADCDHLLKNLKFCLLHHETITLPAKVITANNLSSSMVECLHIKELAEFQENLELKLMPNIKIDDFSSGTFNKIKVNKTKNFMSRDVSASLKFLAIQNSKQAYWTTAFFIEIISKWFTLMTSRTSKVALGKTSGNTFSEKKFEESIAFLESVIELFQEMIVGNGMQFKPMQRGVIISTIIELSTYLINEKGYQYVLAGRLTSDCVENIFSCIRARQPTPNALQFIHNLKIIAVSKYLKPIGNFSYEEDDRIIVGDFLNRPKIQKIKEKLPYVPGFSNKNIILRNIENNVLYNIAEYILSRVSKSNISCESCLNSAGSPTYKSISKFVQFVQLPCFRKNTLFFVNEITFQYFQLMEIIIRQYLPYLKSNYDANKYDLVHFFNEKMQHIPCVILKNCHNIKQKIMIRFIRFRLQIGNPKGRLPNKTYNSKTMAMHATVR